MLFVFYHKLCVLLRMYVKEEQLKNAVGFLA